MPRWRNDINRLIRRYVEKRPDGCWLWTGKREVKGYGRTTIDNRSVLVHRYFYEQLVGPIPAGLTLDHQCRVRHCVNPAHLEAVTNRENILRGDTFQGINARKTHCVRGHEFTDANTWIDARGARICRSCRAVYDRARHARRHAQKMEG